MPPISLRFLLPKSPFTFRLSSTSAVSPVIISSPHPPLNPDVQKAHSNVFDYLFSPTLGHIPTSVAFIDSSTGEKLSRSDVYDQALALATGLRNRKPLDEGKKKVVAVLSETTLDFAVGALGVMKAGWSFSPVNVSYTPQEIASQFALVKPSIILLSPKYLSTFSKVEFPSSLPKPEIYTLSKANSTAEDKQSYQSYTTLSSTPSHEWGNEEPVQPALLCLSSGTSGNPKAVSTSHLNLISVVGGMSVAMPPITSTLDPNGYKSSSAQLKDELPNGEERRTRPRRGLAVLPTSHIYGFVKNLLWPLREGGEMVLMPRFDLIRFFQAISTYEVTWSLIVPPVLLAMAHTPLLAANSARATAYNLSSLEWLLSGAAPMSPNLPNLLLKHPLLKHIIITEGYGLTETSPTVFVLPLKDSGKKRGSVGVLIPGVEGMVGEMGEVLLRGDSIFEEYLEDKDSTKNAFIPDPAPHGASSNRGKWFRTGDVGRVDEDGYWYIVDRLKELIKYNGYQVPPSSLESLLLSHPKLKDAAVIGVWSERLQTELPRAYVVLKEDLSLEEGPVPVLVKVEDGEIEAWVSERVAPFMRLRGGVEVVESIPKSSAGKILRRVLRKQAEGLL